MTIDTIEKWDWKKDCESWATTIANEVYGLQGSDPINIKRQIGKKFAGETLKEIIFTLLSQQRTQTIEEIKKLLKGTPLKKGEKKIYDIADLQVYKIAIKDVIRSLK